MKKRIDRFLEIVLMALLVILVVAVLWQVFTRYILDSPSSYTEELARFLLVWLGVLGASYVAGLNRHVAISLLPEKLDEKQRKRLSLCVNILVITCAFCVFLLGGSRLVYLTIYLEQKSPALGVPMGLVYSVLPISGLFILYYKINSILND